MVQGVSQTWCQNLATHLIQPVFLGKFLTFVNFSFLIDKLGTIVIQTS